MDLDTYQLAAARTIAPEKHTIEQLWTFVGLGLAGEAAEILVELDRYFKALNRIESYDKSHMVAELGDIAWYIAAGCTLLDIAMSTFPPLPLTKFMAGSIVVDMVIHAGSVADMVKKYVIHARPLDHITLINHLAYTWLAVTSMAEFFNIPLSHIFDTNITKLAARYPEGFVREDERTS